MRGFSAPIAAGGSHSGGPHDHGKVAWPPFYSAVGYGARALPICCRGVPGKRTRRSLNVFSMRTPFVSERVCIVALARIALNAPPGFCLPGFPWQLLQLRFECIPLGTANTDHL